MKRAIIKVDGIDIHIKKVGEGFPLVLLHASPSSSAMFTDMAEILKNHFTVIMPDTPGYGLSDSLPISGETEISSYMPYFHKLFKQMGLNKFAIYGTATGAQLAIRYGLTYPKQVEHLFLDNAAHFNDDQYQIIKEKYFPNLRPRYNGRHLLRMWTVVRDMFRYFPWFQQAEDSKLTVPPLPASFYHKIAMEFLQAGKGYVVAYEAAFGHEHAKNVQDLQVPATIIRHETSIVLPFIDQLLAHTFPANIRTLKTSGAPATRYAEMLAHMQTQLPLLMDRYGEMPNYDLDSGQFCVKVEGKYIHGWQEREGEGMPIVLVPNPGESAAVWKDKLTIIRKGRPGVVLSLPGQGDSDVWDGEGSKEREVVLIGLLMKKLNFSSFELIHAAKSIPSIEIQEPDAYGMYMLKAWMELREKMGEKPDPKRMHLILRERLKYRGSRK